MTPWPGQQMISLADFEKFAGVSRRVIYGMIERGELQAVQLGKRYRIPRAEAFRVLGLRDTEGAAELALSYPKVQLSPGAAALERSLNW